MGYCNCCGKRYDSAKMCPSCKKRDTERKAAAKQTAKDVAWQYDVSSTRGAGHVPAVSVDFVLEPHGYQMDLYIEGKLEGIFCRDFGGDHDTMDLRNDLVAALAKAVTKWREKH